MQDADPLQTTDSSDTADSLNSADRTNSTNTASTTRTSNSLIIRVKANDQAAWERLVKLYSPLVYFWCRQSGLPRHDVNDLFQDVFHTLARNIDKYRPMKNGSFRGWLRTITRNKLNDFFRKNGRQPIAAGGTEALHHLEQVPDQYKTDADASESSACSEEQTIQKTILRNALENIRPHFSGQTWNAFWKVAIDGRETSDVANELSMKPGTVRVAKSRVLKRLRLELGDLIE